VDKQGRTALDLALKYNHFAVADYLRRQGVPHAGDRRGDATGSGYDGSFRAAGEVVGAARYMSRGGGGGGGSEGGVGSGGTPQQHHHRHQPQDQDQDQESPSAPPVPECDPTTALSPSVHANPSLIFGSGGESGGRGGGGGGGGEGPSSGVNSRVTPGGDRGGDVDRGDGHRSARFPAVSAAVGRGHGGVLDTSRDEELARRLATEEFLAAQSVGGGGVHGAGPQTPMWAAWSAPGEPGGGASPRLSTGASPRGTPRVEVDESPVSDASSTSYSDNNDDGPLLRPD
jgi:hypothetical protein